MSKLQNLPGARIDARTVFDALIDPDVGAYDEADSRLLIDASRSDVIECIADALYGADTDTFTFYFAGHGGSKNESYALCCSDTNLDRFGVSALAMGEIFRLINDTRPLHSNIIVDACYAAGLLADFGNLLKPSVLGPANSSSISILAMSASDRESLENEEGGLGTTALLQCLNGKPKVSSRKEFLSLEDVGNAISPLLTEQAPTTWSFAISGASKFVKNPIFSRSTTEAANAIPTFGVHATTLISKQNAELIWKHYIALTSEVNPRSLQESICHLLAEVESSQDQANLLLGLFESFSARASASPDAFSIIEVQCAILFSADKILDENVRRELRSYLISQIDEALTLAVEHFRLCLSHDYGLVSKGNAFAEFFALPIRLTKIAAWTIVSIELAETERQRAKRKTYALEILEGLADQYQPSFSLLSEEQAPYVHAISSLAPKFGLASWAESYISSLYNDYFFFGKKVAKTKLQHADVLSFMKHRLFDQKPDFKQFVARPSELLFVLLHHFVQSGREDIIRYDLSELDHQHVSTFVPDTYEGFTNDVIVNGANIGFQIGFDVFTVAEFASFAAESVHPKVADASRGLSENERTVALLASLIYPNRVAWFV